MGTKVLYAIAALFLFFGNAQSYERHIQYFGTPQPSSPAPPPLERQPETDMKELVLFLTPDQVKTLMDAGAVVQAVPEYEAEFAELQQKLRESINNEEKDEQQQYQAAQSPRQQDQEQESLLENYYKLLNIHEINEDLAQQQQQEQLQQRQQQQEQQQQRQRQQEQQQQQQPTTEAATENTVSSTPRYKYTKSRQQNKDKQYYKTYVQKTSNRAKAANQNTNTEYVRFLPTYENENLKMIPYEAIPLLPYVYEAQGNYYHQEKLQLSPNGASQSRENAYGQANNARPNSPLQARDEAQRGDVKPVVEELQEPEQPEAIVEVPAPEIRLNPEALRAQHLQGYRETLASIEGLAPLEPVQKRPTSTPAPTPAPAPARVSSTPQTPIEKQEQASRLLAPLYQHQSISDIAAQKASLLNSELEIHSKLQEIRESPQHDDNKYSEVISKLNSNLEKQNQLAKIEALSKLKALEKKSESKGRPIEIVKQTEPQGIQIPVQPAPESSESASPAPQAIPVTFIRPVPVPTLKTVKVEKTVSVKESPLLSKFLNLGSAQEAQKSAAEQVKPALPIKLFYRPEKLTITRHIWEH